jgi:hypothetical protein
MRAAALVGSFRRDRLPGCECRSAPGLCAVQLRVICQGLLGVQRALRDLLAASKTKLSCCNGALWRTVLSTGGTWRCNRSAWTAARRRPGPLRPKSPPGGTEEIRMPAGDGPGSHWHRVSIDAPVFGQFLGEP